MPSRASGPARGTSDLDARDGDAASTSTTTAWNHLLNNPSSYNFAPKLARANARAVIDAVRALGEGSDSVGGDDGSTARTALAMDASFRDGLIRCSPDVVTRLRREANVTTFYGLEAWGEIPESDDSTVIVFACRPQLANMVTVAEHVRSVRRRRDAALRARAEEVASRDRGKRATSAVEGLLTRVASATGRGVKRGGKESDSSSNANPDADGFPEIPPLPKMYVLCAPRVTEMCEHALRDLHALDYVTMVQCECDLVPIEPDVFTMEYPEAYSEIVTEEWHASAYYVAAALHKLQRDFTGLAPVVKGKGDVAHKVAQLLLEMRLGVDPVIEEPAFVEPGVDCDSLIDMIVLIDRDVDMVTPLCTQLTYEGLIDEILGIEKGAVAIPQRAFDGDGKKKDVVKTDDPAKREEKYVRARAHKAGPIAMRPKLNNTDRLFDQIRDMNFGRACNVIRDLATAIKEDYDAIKGSNVEDQHVSEIGDFVKKIKANIGGTGLDLHATLAKYLIDCTKKKWFQNRLECERLCVEGEDLQTVMDHLETMIYRGDEAIPCLRMVVLACVCFNGFPPKMHEKIFSDLFNAFGPEILLKLEALETAGLFVDRETAKKRSRGFAQMRKPLKLIADGVDGSEEPNDITFAYSSSGYAPLSVRLVEAATRGSWKSIAPNNSGEDLLKHLPGELFEYTQGENDYGRPVNSKVSYREFNKRREKAAPLDGKDELWPKPTVMVFFIGGVTYAEIACLRHLAKKRQCGCNFVIGTTKIFQGDALIDTCGEDIERLETRLRVDEIAGRGERIRL